MMNDDDGPPEDVVDGVQSTMTGLVDKAGGAVAAMAASVGDAVKASLGGVLKSSAPPAALDDETAHAVESSLRPVPSVRSRGSGRGLGGATSGA